MKRLAGAMMGLFLTLSSALGSDLLDGLVGYWPFDGNARDFSGNGNHGSTHGVSLTIDRQDNSGMAYLFGEGKYISVGANTQLNSITDFTLCLWLKANSWTEEYWVAVACKGATRQCGFQILSEKPKWHNQEAIRAFLNFINSNPIWMDLPMLQALRKYRWGNGFISQ